MRRARVLGLILGVMAVVQVAAATGCTSTQASVQRWQGHQIAELIADRGAADRILSYPYGGTLYIWEQRRTSAAAAGAENRRGGPRFEDVILMQAFLVDESGVITRIESKTVTASPGRSAR